MSSARDQTLEAAESELRAELTRLPPWQAWYSSPSSPRVLDLEGLASTHTVARLLHLALLGADRTGASHVRFWVDPSQPTVDRLAGETWIQQLTPPGKLVLPLDWCLKAICRIPAGPLALSWSAEVTLQLAPGQSRRVTVHFLQSPQVNIAGLAEADSVMSLPEDPEQRGSLERASQLHDAAQQALDEGRPAEARQHLERADALCASAGPWGERARINTLLLLADATEHPRQREWVAQQVHALIQRVHGEGSRRTIESQELLASCALKRDNFDEAAYRYHRLRALIAGHHGPWALELLPIYQGLRYCASKRGLTDETDKWTDRKHALEQWWARPATRI